MVPGNSTYPISGSGTGDSGGVTVNAPSFRTFASGADRRDNIVISRPAKDAGVSVTCRGRITNGGVRSASEVDRFTL